MSLRSEPWTSLGATRQSHAIQGGSTYMRLPRCAHLALVCNECLTWVCVYNATGDTISKPYKSFVTNECKTIQGGSAYVRLPRCARDDMIFDYYRWVNRQIFSFPKTCFITSLLLNLITASRLFNLSDFTPGN